MFYVYLEHHIDTSSNDKLISLLSKIIVLYTFVCKPNLLSL
jgi:hypothetical protein